MNTMVDGPRSIRVLLVDDSILVREGLRAVLSSHGAKRGIMVVGEAGTAADAVAKADQLTPDLVLLDIRLPDGSGLLACREILRVPSPPRVLILTSVASDQLIHQAVLAGAQGYLMKEIDPDGLITAIVDAAAGKSVLTPEVTERVMRLLRAGSSGSAVMGLSSLSPQERKVLELVAEGLTNKEVADRLKLSDNTVKNYLVNVFEKLQVKRRSQAVAIFTHSTDVTRP